MRIAIVLGLVFTATTAKAQSWEELQQTAPTNTEVRVEELGGKRGHVEGILQSVEDMQLTIAKGTTPVIIPRDRIARVQQKKKDPVWEGLILGLIHSGVSHAAFGSGWSGRETAWNYVGSAGFWTLIDWSIQGRRTVYRVP